jgi:hypothetical protein
VENGGCGCWGATEPSFGCNKAWFWVHISPLCRLRIIRCLDTGEVLNVLNMYMLRDDGKACVPLLS